MAVPVMIAIAPPRVVGIFPEPGRVRRVRGRLLTVPAPPGVGPPRHPERSLGTVGTRARGTCRWRGGGDHASRGRSPRGDDVLVLVLLVDGLLQDVVQLGRSAGVGFSVFLV